MKKEVIVFGAGLRGREFIQMTKHELEVLAIVDNDISKQGKQLENIIIESPEYLKTSRDIPVVIAVDNYVPIVLQLEEELGVYNYILWSLFYQNDLQCKSRKLMERKVKRSDVCNAWMNHLVSAYRVYDKLYFADGGSCLDVGCGCCKELFYRLCKGYDAWGIDCCEWKREFFNQKVEDFSFPKEWKERFVFGYGEALPFEDERFDTVTCWYVLEHVQDYEKCIMEMLRVTKKGGYVLINAPDYRNSWEEHYQLDFGKPLAEHKEEFWEFLANQNQDLSTLEELNFITKQDVLKVLNQYQKEIGALQILDLEELHPEGKVTQRGNEVVYFRRIALIIQKL